MADRLTPVRRSANMAAIRGQDTAPERAVRRALHGLGVGYRLQDRSLPGKPDIVMKGRGAVILVHGCFWHRHEACREASTPKTRAGFWEAKFAKNVERDRRNLQKLLDSGWSVLVVWECETADAMVLSARVADFLNRGTDAKGGQNKGRRNAD